MAANVSNINVYCFPKRSHRCMPNPASDGSTRTWTGGDFVYAVYPGKKDFFQWVRTEPAHILGPLGTIEVISGLLPGKAFEKLGISRCDRVVVFDWTADDLGECADSHCVRCSLGALELLPERSSDPWL